MRTSIPIAASLLALGACASSTFDFAALEPTPEGEQITLTGYFDLNGLQFRLYPGQHGDNATCLSGALTSLAGIPTPEFTNRQRSLTGHLHRATDPEAENIPNPCGAALVMLANEVVVP